MKKLLLVALLTPMVAMPSSRAQRIAQQQAYLAKQEGRSAGSTTAPVPTPAPAPVPGDSVAPASIAAELASNLPRLTNLLAAFAENNGLALTGGNADAGQADYRRIFVN